MGGKGEKIKRRWQLLNVHVYANVVTVDISANHEACPIQFTCRHPFKYTSLTFTRIKVDINENSFRDQSLICGQMLAQLAGWLIFA